MFTVSWWVVFNTTLLAAFVRRKQWLLFYEGASDRGMR
jgi:hypothetical protein